MSKIIMGPEKGPVPILAGYPTDGRSERDGKPISPLSPGPGWLPASATITVALQHHRYSLKGSARI
jgi:hypothetical protein